MLPLHCFLGLTSAVIVRSSESGCKIYSIRYFWYSTFVIILGSVLLIISKKIIKRGKNPFDYIFLTFVCGVIFRFFNLRDGLL